jgi:hypothetical protein
MADQEHVRDLGRLLGAAARAHHEEHGSGPAPRWAGWYAEWLEGKLTPHLGFEPDVEQIEAWLSEADERFQAEKPEKKWPYFYAELILDSATAPDRVTKGSGT